MFLLQSDKNSGCYGNLQFPLTYNGKSGTRQFLLSHCRYLDFLFTEMFLEQSSTIHMNFVQIAEFDWLPWQHKEYIFEKKYSKIFSSEAVREMKLKLCIHVHDISLYINFGFYCHCPCAFVAMATLKFPYTYNGKRGNWHLFLCYCRYFE